MTRAKLFTVLAAAATICIVTPAAKAQLDDKIWVGGTGNQVWQLDANWQLNAMPTTFPNDPGRVDPDPATITNVIGANLGVNLAAGLNLDVGATDVTVAALTLGSTGSPVATNITSTGGRLVFENYESNNTVPEPDVCAFNCGVAQITSAGVAGATNTITATLGLHDNLDVTGATPLTIAGNIVEMSDNVSLRARAGATTFITGGITLLDTAAGAVDDIPLALNSNTDSLGTIEVNSVISGTGRMRYGTVNQGNVIPGKTIVRSANTYSGRNLIGRGTLVLANNSALGTGDLKEEGPSEGSLQTGYNIESDNDTRTIANNRIVGQWLTIKGENSLKWTGRTYQTNSRGWINMLPQGKTFTITGQQFTFEVADGALDRFLTFDGSGKTIITGGIRNRWDALTNSEVINTQPGHLRVRGTGTVVIDGDELVANSDSNFTATVTIDGGNLHFANNSDFGVAARAVSEGGAVGVDSGVVNNPGFLGLFNSAASPAADAAGNMVVFDRGGLMLGNGEYGASLDFTGAHASVANMSLAAHETGSSYTGTITPANSTYRLGGGSGVLTLPNANQLTGANNLIVTNGGEVVLPVNNNYTGTTSVVAKVQTTLQNAAANNTPNFQDGDNVPNDQMYFRPTLTVSNLANGGAASSIGSATNAAGNIVVHGGTLKYTGGAVSTDRLFTIGSVGGTIDASGSGAVNFTNTGTMGVAVAATRNGNVNTFATGNGAADATTIRKLTTTDDLAVGMPISGAGIPAGATITRIAGPTDVVISLPIPFAFNLDTPISFGAAPERKLTLSGNNTGNNTLAAVIPNASNGGLVGVTKTGSGKWVLTGNNTYTGSTAVNAGTLLVNGAHTGAGAVTVAAGATLGGTGSLAAAVTNNGTIGPGASVGTLTLGAGLTMGANSAWNAELLGTTSDLLAITGNLDLSALGNTLNVIDLGKTGTSWLLATVTGAITGTFENITSGYSVDYGTTTPGQLRLNLTGPVPVLGDYNGNGTVDAADYAVWRKAVSLGSTSLPNRGTGIMGVVGSADYDFWKSRFGATSGAGAGSLFGGAAVPEPSSVLLALLAVVSTFGMFGRSRRTAESR